MTRFREFIEDVRKAHPEDQFLADFAESCRVNPAKARAYRTYDDALRVLDTHSWHILKGKAIRDYRNHRRGQLKQPFFNQLNEAFAYGYLTRQGCTHVEILQESNTPTPDIRYVEAGALKHCEVKSIGLSDAEIQRRESGEVHETSYERLDNGFLNKLSSAIGKAKAQIDSQGTDGLVYLIVRFDDMAPDYQGYKRQLREYFRKHDIRDVYIKFGLRGSRRICAPSS